MSEREPYGYKFRHAQRISMDDYGGIAGDIMVLNDPTADGLMRVADIRRNIVIQAKHSQRTIDYDQVGHYRVGKFLKQPKFNEATDVVDLQADTDNWYILIDDQSISRQVAQQDNGSKKFDDAFTNEFKHQLKRGINGILISEKVFGANGNKRSDLIDRTQAYIFTAVPFIALSAAETQGIQHLSAVEAIAFTVVTYSMLNTAGMLVSGGFDLILKKLGHETVWNKDPFMKSSVFEIPLPPVPTDRLLRGGLYLKMHGNKLITTEKS